MKLKSLLSGAFVGVVLNELVLFTVSPFLVSWGAPKALPISVFYFFLSTPLNAQSSKALFWFVALNGALWGMVGYSLYKLIAYFKNQGAAR